MILTRWLSFALVHFLLIFGNVKPWVKMKLIRFGHREGIFYVVQHCIVGLLVNFSELNVRLLDHPMPTPFSGLEMLRGFVWNLVLYWHR